MLFQCAVRLLGAFKILFTAAVLRCLSLFGEINIMPERVGENQMCSSYY